MDLIDGTYQYLLAYYTAFLLQSLKAHIRAITVCNTNYWALKDVRWSLTDRRMRMNAKRGQPPAKASFTCVDAPTYTKDCRENFKLFHMNSASGFYNTSMWSFLTWVYKKTEITYYQQYLRQEPIDMFELVNGSHQNYHWKEKKHEHTAKWLRPCKHRRASVIAFPSQLVGGQCSQSGEYGGNNSHHSQSWSWNFINVLVSTGVISRRLQSQLDKWAL